MLAQRNARGSFLEPVSDVGVIKRRDIQLTPAAARAAEATPADALAAWMARLAPASLRSMSYWLGRFASWACGAGAAIEDGLRAIDAAGIRGGRAMVRAWIDELLAAGLASGSAATAAHSVGAAVRALHEAGAIPFALGRVAPRVERRRDVRGPGRAAIVALLLHLDELAAAGDEAAARDAVAVSLMHNAALRRGEVVQIRVEQLELNGSDPSVVTRRKGHREPSRVLIDDSSAARIRRWLQLRGDAAGFMLVRLRDRDFEQALTGEGLRLALQRRARQLGIPVLRPHGLRHSAATHCLKAGSLLDTQALGGWASTSTIADYIDMSNETRRKALRLVEA
jgi:integrase/recombinase XerC